MSREKYMYEEDTIDVKNITIDNVQWGGRMSDNFAKDLANIFLSGFPFKSLSKDFKTRSNQFNSIVEYIKDDNKYWIVMRYLKDPIGILSIENDQLNIDYELYVANVSILPQYRKLGLLKKLLEKVCEVFHTGLWLDVNKGNPAYNRYKSYGFIEYGPSKEEEEQSPREDDELYKVVEKGEGTERVIMTFRC
jgi:ribosomal protein S18 acetylase RimI-like enzyme